MAAARADVAAVVHLARVLRIVPDGMLRVRVAVVVCMVVVTCTREILKYAKMLHCTLWR